MRRLLLLLSVSLGACAAPAGPRTLAPGLVLDAAAGEVRVEGIVALDEGWLEQVACLEGTRDHEVLVTTNVQPSAVHGALLLLGVSEGAPGSWRWVDDRLVLDPPRGAAVDVLIEAGDGEARPVSDWIRGVDAQAFPDAPWIFAGSIFTPARSGGEVYEADRSGSLVGIVTFGDEVLAWGLVLPDLVEVQEPLWMADPDAVPPPGTAVTLVLRPRR